MTNNKINKQAVEILSQIPKPLAVVGVAGQYRTGKSYLLNRVILNQNRGFPVGPTINPCTKGIWMWGRPLKGFTKEGKNVNIIILDSEGLGATDEETGHDSRIFSLVMLLSSCFVYNSTGTIDESALENLSLIVDLTKNIQIKSKPGSEDLDYEDYAYYMPSFIWVVRDFSLELSDKNHNKMTPDEYFEEALLEQDGNSDQIEQKNRIRRILSNFFTERHCFTLVRPVNEEEQLKNIESLPIDQLRPEFVTQIGDLRSQIVDCARMKTLESYPLSGDMFANLVNSYVSAINLQKIPVIENCWNYVCKNECHKAKETAIRMYDEEMTSAFSKRWPISKKSLKDLNKEYFEGVLRVFRELNYGEIQKKYEEDLIFVLRTKYQDYKYENEGDFEAKFKRFMENLFVEKIAVNLKGKLYKSFFDLENDFKFLEKEIKESNIEGPGKQLFSCEFIAKKQGEVFKQFLGNLKDELENQLSELREQKSALEAQADNQRIGSEKEKKKNESKFTEMQEEAENTLKRIRLVEETMQRLKSEKDKTELFYENRLREISEELNEELRKSVQEKEVLALERNQIKKEIVEVQSKSQSEIALLANQVKILEERKHALWTSDKNREEEIDRLQTENQIRVSELFAKNEAVLKDKNLKIETLNEELLDFEERHQNLERNFASNESEWENNDKSQKKTILELKSKLEIVLEKNKLLERNSSQKNSGTVAVEKHNESVERVTELEELLRQRDLLLKQSKQQLEKETAINKQSNENTKHKYEELRKKFEDLNSEYEKIISLSENDANDKQEDLIRQMAMLKEDQSREIQNLETQNAILQMKLEEETRRLFDDKAMLEQDKTEFETQSRLETARVKLALDKSERTVKTLGNEMSLLKIEHEDEFCKLEEKSRLTIQELEEGLETLKKNNKTEIREMLRKKEEDLKNMQVAYEEEKEMLENKMNEEKEKLLGKISTLSKVGDSRLADLRRETEESLEAKDLEFQNQREVNFLSEQRLHSDVSNKIQKINEQAEQVKVLSEKYEAYRVFADNRICQMQRDLDSEQEGLLKERDVLKKQLNEKENAHWESVNDLNSAVSDFSKYKESSLSEIRKLENELGQTKAEVDLWKSKSDNLAQNSVEQKTELEKQLLMAQQQNKFKSEMNEELKKKLDHEKSKGDDRLKTQKDHFEKEKNAADQKNGEALKNLEQKINEKRKQQRDLETKLEMKISECEKLKLNFEDKVNFLQGELTGRESELADKTIKLKEKVKKWKENSDKVSKACDKLLKESAEKNRQLEDHIFDLQGTIEKDLQIHSENKSFYQGQIDKLKSEAENSQRRFDLIFNKFNKKKDLENQDGQNTQNTIIQSLTDNHRSQLGELTQKYSLEIKAMTEKCQKLERELKQIKEGYFVETKVKLENYDLLESSVSELRETEKTLQRQIAQTKQEKDAKIKSIDAKFTQEIEKYKNKIADLERTVSEREKSMEKAKFSTQSEKTKLGNQIDTLKLNVKSLREQLKESEEAREKAGIDIEKLKGQNRKDRMLLNGQNTNSKWRMGSFGVAKTNDQSMNGDSVNGEMRYQGYKDTSRDFVNEDASYIDTSSYKN